MLFVVHDLRDCIGIGFSPYSTYGGSVRKASTLRGFRYYEPDCSEPGMDCNETNRGWCSEDNSGSRLFVVVPP